LKINWFLPILFLSFLISACLEAPNHYTHLPPGKWRGILKLTDPEQSQNLAQLGEDQKIVDYFELPFNMLVEYEGSEMKAYLLNGPEKIEIEHVHLGRDASTAKDTLMMRMTAFDTYMDGFYEENTIEGYWVVNYKTGYRIPYIITFGEEHRFTKIPVDDTEDFSGDWKMVFDYDKNPYTGIAEFTQTHNELNGTIRTETGDYRYLQGNAYADKLRLSVFDGAHAFLFSGTLDQDTIYGEFRSGKHYKTKWYATKDKKFQLANPNEMTKATTQAPIDFSYKSSDGTNFALSSLPSDKLTIVNIMGTWCPNCKDEINYLKELKATGKYNLSIVSLAFERYKDESKALEKLSSYKSTMDVDWPIVLGGYADKAANSEQLEFIDKLYSYPTMLILDGDKVIKHIHTGFSGPATSKYEAFKSEMDNLLTTLNKEL
jgi:thiol-disulfide isomerase/thioredoxin